MGVVLLVLGILAWLAALFTFAGAQSAIHQIFAAVIGVSGAVLIGCGGIIVAVVRVEERLKPPEQRKPEPKVDPPLV